MERERRSRDYWREQLSEYWDGGLTIQEYCELKDLPYESVRRWIGILKKEREGKSPVSGELEFVEVPLSAGGARNGSDSGISLHAAGFETPDWKGRMILSVGSILLELAEKKTGWNLLRSPETIDDLKFQPEVYGFPVLIPPNCIYKGLFSWRGRNYHLPVNNRFGNHIHGVVLNRKWHLADSGEENGAVWVETSYTYNAENEMFEGFPHEFRADLRYTFLPDRVLQRLTVTNIGPETMPLGTGFHSTFRFPLGDQSSEAYRTSSVRVTTADFYWKFDMKERFAITGEKAAWNGYDDFRHGKIINRQPISRQCPVVEARIGGKPFRGAILDFPVPRIKVVYRWDEKFGQTALWNREGMEDFFCAEPMSWMADSPNLPLPESVTGLYPLEPGEVWSAENTISVERY